MRRMCGGALAITEVPIDGRRRHADHLVIFAVHGENHPLLDVPAHRLAGDADELSGFCDRIMLLDGTAVGATLAIHCRRYREGIGEKNHQQNWAQAAVSVAVSNRRSTLFS